MFANIIILSRECRLEKADLKSLDFVIDRLFVKLFRTNNMDTVRQSQQFIMAALCNRGALYFCPVVSSFFLSIAPFPQIDIIGDVMIVWRVRGKTYQVCSVQYCVQQLCTVRCTDI